jgi:hypothetical protein
MSKIGVFITDVDPGARDAVHSPIVLVESTEKLSPGQPVRFTDGTLTAVVGLKNKEHHDLEEDEPGVETPHAIVDPFIGYKAINPGTRFWVFLYPGTTGAMTHNFNVDLEKMEALVRDLGHEQWCSGYGCD